MDCIQKARRSKSRQTSGLVPKCITSLFESPENREIYGDVNPRDPELIDLARDIKKNGVLEPIVTTRDNYIVSGHRRYTAAKLAGLKEVPTTELDVRRFDLDAHEYKRLLRRYNHQRHKTTSQRLNEKLLDVDADIAYRQLIADREARDADTPAPMVITGSKTRSRISLVKRPMLSAAVRIIESLGRYWPLTVRQVHYQMLNDPPLRNANRGDSTYINDRNSYKDLCDLLARARLAELVPFESITDETRPVNNLVFSRDAAAYVDLELHHLFRRYRRDLMQSQRDHIEIVAEKLTVQSIIQRVAKRYCIPLTIGRGYCSLEPRRQIVQRFVQSGKDRLVLLAVSDFDPDGDEIAESFARSLRDDFVIDNDRLVAHKVMLNSEQIRAWGLPENRLEAKKKSANYKKFVARHRTNKVYELEAIPPKLMQEALADFIDTVIDIEAFNAELAAEREDAGVLEAHKQVVVDAIRDGGDADAD